MKRTTKIFLASTALLATIGVGTVTALAHGGGDGFRGQRGGGMGMMGGMGGGMMGGGMGGGGMMGGMGGPKVMFWLLDRNEDGAVDRAEFDALREQMFLAKDSNGDGKLTVEDWKGPRAQMNDDDDDDNQGDDDRRGVRRGGMMERLDTDNDGGISKEEFLARPARMFDLADADDDGKVTLDEAESLAQDMRAMNPHRRGGYGRGYEGRRGYPHGGEYRGRDKDRDDRGMMRQGN